MAIHSKLGASSTHRWMHCPGSVALIDQLEAVEGGKPDNTSEHAAAGTNAHWIGSTCLEEDREPWEFTGRPWTIDGHSGVTTIEDTAAVQVYVDYIRSLPATRLLVEHAFHCPDIDEAFFGTSDAVVDCADGNPGDRVWLEVVDYKHGAGVPVDPVGNTQALQYAAGAIMELLADDKPVPDEVRLTIVQPRCGGGAPKTWTTTKDYVLAWVENEWKPAAQRTKEPGAELVYGEHCRFCPAKLRCPALHGIMKRLTAMADAKLVDLEGWELASALDAYETLKILGKALLDEAFTRVSRNQTVPGWKLVDKRSDRAWKENAEAAVAKTFGEEAYSKPTLLSPAAVDKLPGGKAFTKSWAFKPETGKTIARATDAREGVKGRSAAEVFGVTEG